MNTAARQGDHEQDGGHQGASGSPSPTVTESQMPSMPNSISQYDDGRHLNNTLEAYCRNEMSAETSHLAC